MNSQSPRAGGNGAHAPRAGAIGTRTPLIDGVDKVTGRARYTADIAAPGALVGRILRSPHAHARIVAIDTSAARALAGVHAVCTGEDTPVPYGVLPIAENEYPLARGKVRYRGDPVAAVAADDEATAERALALVSMATMRACACGLRRMRPTSAPGAAMSAV